MCICGFRNGIQITIREIHWGTPTEIKYKMNEHEKKARVRSTKIPTHQYRVNQRTYQHQ